MTRLKRWFRRLRTLLWTALAMVIIGAAVLVGIGKLLMPYSERYKPQLEAVLSEQFNQPVQLEGFTGEWKAFGPRLSLEGVKLLGADSDNGALAIQRAALDIKPLNALFSGRPLYRFEIIGANLALLRAEDGAFELSGLGLSGRRIGEGGGSALGNLARLGEVRLLESSFSFRDEARALEAELTGIEGRLQLSGDRFALQLQASLSNARRNRVLGDFSATVLARLGEDNRPQEIEFQLETGELILEEIAPNLPRESLRGTSGRVNAQLWGEWSPTSPLALAGVADLRDLALPDGDRMVQLDHLNGRLDMRWQDKTQWRIDLADVRVEENGRDWIAPRIAVERNLPGNLGVWVSADYLEAAFPLEATQLFMRLFGNRWPQAAPTAGSGPVYDFDLVINGNKKLIATSGRFENIEVLEWGRWPLARGLNGEVDLAFGEGSLRVSGEDVLIRWDRNFRSPLLADLRECDIEILWNEADDYQIDARDCALQNEDVSAAGRLRFLKDEGKPRVDIDVRLDAPDIARLHDYWPASIMNSTLTDWLSRSVTRGELSDGRLLIQGDMDAFPFRAGDGTMLAEAVLSDGALTYAPAWPSANGVDATLRFEGAGMSATGSIAALAGAPVQQAEATIEDFKAPILELAYGSDASLKQLKRFIAESPLLDGVALDLERLALAGTARTEGELRIPFGGRGSTTVAGTLQLLDGTFTEQRSGFRLDALLGTVSYDRSGARGESIGTTLAGWPATVSLDAAWGTSTPFDASLAGVFPASLVVDQSPLADDPLLRTLDGEAEWLARLNARRASPDADTRLTLSLSSDLVGVSSGLPAPLDKAPATPLPLSLAYPLGSSPALLAVQLGERAELALELSMPEPITAPGEDQPGTGPREGESADPEQAAANPQSPGDGPAPAPGFSAADASGLQLLRGALAFDQPLVLPAPGIFALGGSAETLDLDGWVAQLSGYAATSGMAPALELQADTLQLDQLIMLNRVFNAVTLDLDLDLAARALSATVDSPDLAGEVRLAQNDAGIRSLTANLERLYMPEALDTGVSMDTDPTQLPEMHFYIDDLNFKGLDLGTTRIEAFPIGNGLRIESVDAESSQLTFQARGDWVVGDAGSRSDFDIVLTSESLGELVNALDLSSVLEGGQTMVRYDAWWPGPPAAFSLAALNGQMTFSVIDGRILNADPGAGRVLGLMSVGALPRRLALDFSDVFSSGFGFDQASGTLVLDSGTAFTDDFLLESTAAQLEIQGVSDLEAQTFDYQMTVRPGVSQALPVIGAIAAGPAGAAAGLALQGLFRNALGDAAEARYAITGTWSEPEVLRLEAESTPAADTSTPTPAPIPVPSPAEPEKAQAQRMDDT